MPTLVLLWCWEVDRFLRAVVRIDFGAGDCQVEVSRAREKLSERGVTCWMDVSCQLATAGVVCRPSGIDAGSHCMCNRAVSGVQIDGGMKQNIYASMAAGVADACCVAAFMSAAYEKSENWCVH